MTDGRPLTRVLILGGYGVFGGKLAQALLRSPQYEVIIAGRSRAKAKAFCNTYGGTPAVLDRSSPEAAPALAALCPFVTVDATGPFQAFDQDGYRIAHAALEAGSHYLDLCDDAAFTKGIVQLDEEAKAKGRSVLSGVSSVPALSSAAVEALRGDFSRLDTIDTVILPGNRAPRGLAVIRAILAQTGQPMQVYRNGSWGHVPGWSGLARRRLTTDRESLPLRWCSWIGAPDLQLFPDHYGARSVLFKAGLELSLMHLGLAVLGWLVRLRLFRSLVPFTGALKWIADRLEPFGTDKGGMEVRLSGLGRDQQPLAKSWTLIAGAGDGPHVPAVAATILCGKLADGNLPPGARPCLGAFGLSDIEAATAHLQVDTKTETHPAPCLFQHALGRTFQDLPPEVQKLHTAFDLHRWRGRAKVSRGTSRLGQLICHLIGFPPATEDVPVEVTLERCGNKEHWTRVFGSKTFKSTLLARRGSGKGKISEQFGGLVFDIDLTFDGTCLAFPVTRGRALGVPLPKWLIPVSEAREFQKNGRFHFDVQLSLPMIGKLVRYQGFLTEQAPDEGAAPTQ